MNDIREKLAGRGPAIAAGSAAALVLAALSWVLCTQPLAPAGAAGSGSAEAPVAAASAKEAEKDPAADKGKADDGKKAAADKGSKDDKGEQKKDATPVAKEGEQPAAAGDAKSDSDKAGSQASTTTSGGSTSSKPAQRPSGSGGGSKPTPSPAPQPEAQEPAPAPQPAPKPQHQHSWQAVYRDEPVYEQQWVSNWVEEFKYRQERWVCNPATGGCGATFATVEECGTHCLDMMHGSNLDDSYDVYEKVDKGSYQTVQIGTKQVLDHYACSCGAVK